MELFLHQTIAGLATGAIYASLALALVMIFNSTGHINFAQGEMALVSTYIAWTLMAVGLPYWVAFIVTILFSFLFGVAVERLVVRNLNKSEPLALVVVFIGLLIAFNSIAGWLWGHELKEFPSPVRSLSTGTPLVGPHDLFVMVVTLLLLMVVFTFFRFTKLGLAMRAAALNPTSAKLVGIQVGTMIALGWGLAGALGGAAGMLIAPSVNLDPSMMLGVLLFAFASAMLGGLSNPAGAVAGGLIYGVLENLAGTYLIGRELTTTFALATVVGVLLLKPAGLFGKTIVKRV